MESGISLAEVLDLVGKLDDSQEATNGRDRFRKFIQSRLVEAGQARDFIEECLRTSGDQQRARALQDLVNHVGGLLGFEVEFGRYAGVHGEIGHDGLWKSRTGHYFVVEVKTNETYPIKTATLLGYINELVSEHRVGNQDQCIGLYVIGRPDPQVRQLENAIISEKNGDRLRIISVDSLLSLAEMMSEYDVSHENVLELLRPSGPHLDAIVGLMSRLVGQAVSSPPIPKPPLPPGAGGPEEKKGVAADIVYWMTPVGNDETRTARDTIQDLVGDGCYAFGERTPGRRHMKAGDRICFYEAGKGVVADATLAEAPKIDKPHPKLRSPEEYAYMVKLAAKRLYLDDPIIIDSTLRGKLESFRDRDPSKSWAWFVQATRRLSAADFRVLTRGD